MTPFTRPPSSTEPALWDRRRWQLGLSAVHGFVCAAVGVAAVVLGSLVLLALPAAWAAQRHWRTNRPGLALWAIAWTGIVGLLVWVVPAFEELYQDINTDVPDLTMLLINLADLAAFPPHHTWQSALTILALGYASAGAIAWDGHRTGLTVFHDRLVILAFAAAIGLVLVALFLPLFGEEHHCVAAGTQIATPYGPRRIEALRVGDSVVVRAANHRKTGRVARIRTARTAGCLRLTFENGTTLRVTAIHPVACGRGWIRAGDLRCGELVHTLDGTAPLRSIEHLTTMTTVYDLTIDGESNFYANGVLLHNKLG